MSALEWNPAFGPVVTALLILGTGFFLYSLRARLASRHGRLDSWLLLLPKIFIVALILFALLDPDLRLSVGSSTPAKVLIFRDISSSMDLRDDGSSTRSERTAGLIHEIESAAPASVRFEVVPFDSVVHAEGYAPRGDETRGTDLGGVLAALGSQPKFADADGAVILTDGGDETVDLPDLPSVPLAIVGVGTPPETWDDIGVASVTAPASVEEKSHFDLEADLVARDGTHDNLSALKIALDERHDKNWSEVQAQTVDLSSHHAAVIFPVEVSGAGEQHYRVRLPQLPGELTYANNTREVGVQVQARALHVLFFTQELGVDYKYLRSELAADHGVLFTAMYRVLEDQFTVQGDRTGFQDLAQGFPTRDNVLKRYDCIILGSFPASQFTDAQAEALRHYAENGGAVVFLGGDMSFGLGGYADSTLAPLLPWEIRADEPPLATGHFPVSVADTAAAVGFTAGLREEISAAGGAPLESLNQPGVLRPGAVALLDASLRDRTVPVVAWQHDGKGQMLGIATNTMWKWAASGGETRVIYGRFWRQAVRGLTRKLEGGALLGVSWNQERYRPGEQARVEVQLRSAADAGAIRLVATLGGPGGDREIALNPAVGQANVYEAKVPLPQRGDYVFHLSAYSGANLVENYERALPVAPLLDEGASPELKDAYLRAIAARARGVYAGEADLAPVENFLREHVVAQQGVVTLPLADYRNLLALAVVMLLVAEWFWRRRLNLI